jgi:hypothetical protein
MEKCKIIYPEDLKINKEEDFAADTVLPISIDFVDETKFIILFCIAQDSTETCNYLQVLCNLDRIEEKVYINSLPLSHMNKPDAPINPQAKELYNNAIADIKNNGNIFNTDLVMHVDENHKAYYRAKAAKPNKDGSANILNIMIPRDNYIKISLFFNRLFSTVLNPEAVFVDRKLNNMEFIKVKFLKHDASSTDISSNIVFSHYTCECGPNITYRFNFVSLKIPGKKLRSPLIAEQYDTLYRSHFLINDIIYDPDQDILLAVYEDRSEITDKYKATKILKFTKELYDRTNFIDPTKIYEPEISI